MQFMTNFSITNNSYSRLEDQLLLQLQFHSRMSFSRHAAASQQGEWSIRLHFHSQRKEVSNDYFNATTRRFDTLIHRPRPLFFSFHLHGCHRNTICLLNEHSLSEWQCQVTTLWLHYRGIKDSLLRATGRCTWLLFYAWKGTRSADDVIWRCMDRKTSSG